VKIYNKFNWLGFLIVLLAYSASQNCFSQQILWANKNNLDKKTDFTKVIGQNKFGVYVLKHRNSSFRRYFILEYFDKRMNLLKSKTFKIPNSELEKIVVTPNNIIAFSKEYTKGSLSRLFYQTIDSNFNISEASTIVNFTNPDLEMSDLRIEYNSKKDKFLIWYLSGENETTNLISFILQNKQIKSNPIPSIPSKIENLFIGDALIDDTGNLYLIYSKSEKFKSKLAADFEHRLLAFNIFSNSKLDIGLNDENTFFSGYKLTYNKSLMEVAAFGLTGVTDEDENKGYFSIKISCVNFAIKSKLNNDFDRKLVSQVLGLKNEQKGEQLNKFKIKKLIPKLDGGMLAICERMFITTQSDIFYVNGIPQSTYARIFNNDEVLVLDLDSNGNTNWFDIVNKNQSSINDGGYYNGIVIMVNDAEINILYNDRLSANADIIQVSYNSNGEHSKKILLNNDQFYALLIPSEYNQVTANSIVLPINQNRDFTFIKLLY
jgi:hypothetical protein